MPRKGRPTNPDQNHPRGVPLLEGGPGGLARVKDAKLVAKAERDKLALIHGLDRADDAAIESAPRRFGDTRVRRDAMRSVPRSQAAPLGHRLKDKQLPASDEIRLPITGYEMTYRSRSARSANDTLPAAQRHELRRLVGGPEQHWDAVNGALTSANGSVLQVEKDDPVTAAKIRRVDRAIQAYERHNDRTQVVYANVTMPANVPGTQYALHAYTRKHFKAGDEVTLDQYTLGALNHHEISTGDDAGNGAIALEIRTRRGAYIGGKAGSDDTSYLLPRGLHARVVGVHVVDYNDPQTRAVKSRVVLQLEDLT